LLIIITGENGCGKDTTVLSLPNSLNSLSECEARSETLDLADCQRRKGFISVMASELHQCDPLKARLIKLISFARRSGHIPIVVINEIQGQVDIGSCLLEICNSHHLFSTETSETVSMEKVLILATSNPHILSEKTASTITLTERTSVVQQQLPRNTYYGGELSTLSQAQPAEVLKLMERVVLTIDPLSPLFNYTFRDLSDSASKITLKSRVVAVPFFGHTYVVPPSLPPGSEMLTQEFDSSVESLTSIAEQVIEETLENTTIANIAQVAHMIAVETASVEIRHKEFADQVYSNNTTTGLGAAARVLFHMNALLDRTYSQVSNGREVLTHRLFLVSGKEIPANSARMVKARARAFAQGNDGNIALVCRECSDRKCTSICQSNAVGFVRTQANGRDCAAPTTGRQCLAGT